MDDEYELMREEIKNLKAEMDVLKNSVKSLSGIKEEGITLMKLVDNLKIEISNINRDNEMIAQRIQQIEEEYEDDSEEELEQGEEKECVQVEMLEKSKTENEEPSAEENNYEEDKVDMYQIEIIHNEMVWACNLCDQGCDSSEEIRTHMLNEHGKVLKYIDTGDRKGNIENINESEQKIKECMVKKRSTVISESDVVLKMCEDLLNM